MKRKKTLEKAFLTLIFVLGALLLYSPLANAESAIRIFLNGKEIYCDVPPAIQNNRVLVPVRAISEGMGYYVFWDQVNQTVLVNRTADGPKTAEPGTATGQISLLIDGQKINCDVPPQIVNNRVLVPVRAVSEGLGLDVKWDNVNRFVIITGTTPVVDTNNPPVTPNDPVITPPTTPPSTSVDGPLDPNALDDPYHVTIQGNPIATAAQLKAILYAKNPDAPDVVDLYLSIGRIYGIRGDLAFCQAAKETGWWKYGNLVKPWQNNYCGLGATGTAIADASTVSLNGADPTQVWYETGMHGAFFKTPAVGVEAQMQHLYAYLHAGQEGCPLPSGRTLYDPRYTIVLTIPSYQAMYWQDLSGRWAVPGIGYGQSIVDDFLRPALQY